MTILEMNTWDQDFSQHHHIERVNFEEKNTENSKKNAILTRRRFCDIGILLIIRLKTH